MKNVYKQFLKGAKKADGPARALDVITQEYGQLCGNLGQAYYRMEVLKADVEELRSKIAVLDREASRRRELDKKEAPEYKKEGTNE